MKLKKATLLATPIGGNAHNDHNIFNKVDRFVNEIHSVKDKADVIE